MRKKQVQRKSPPPGSRLTRPAALNPVIVIDHPLVQHNLTKLRNRRTPSEAFRRGVGEVAALMVYEASRSFKVRPLRVTTPLAQARGAQLSKQVLLIPVLRSGLGMLPAILQLIPNALVGFIGVKRHEQTLEAVIYHHSFPARLRHYEIILIDPMLATGGSAVAALNLITGRGAKTIRLVTLIAAPEGIRAIHTRYPKLPIFAAAIDDGLNDRGFIVPGLGDAGDRLFGVQGQLISNSIGGSER